MNQSLIFNNTYKSGKARFFVYQQKNRFIGVCLEFGLIAEAKSLDLAKECIKDIMESYLQNILENKLSEKLLNRPAPKKYWKIYENIISNEQEIVKLQQTRGAIKAYSKLNLSPFLLFNQNYKNGAFITS